VLVAILNGNLETNPVILVKRALGMGQISIVIPPEIDEFLHSDKKGGESAS